MTGLAGLMLALLAACGTPRDAGLKVDHTIKAVGHDSRARVIVLHYTASDTAAALKTLSEQNVSSHYVVTDDTPPRIYQLVDENRRAWHAGVSEWNGSRDVNSVSIGIEIVNRGRRDDQWARYPDDQIRSVMALVDDVARRHSIKPENIVGHSDVAPQRKQDPGPAFPWERLARAGLGRWYDTIVVQQHMQQLAIDGLPDARWLQDSLRRLGYGVPASGLLDPETRKVLAAFQMHYRPARHDGLPDAQTIAIIRSLLPDGPDGAAATPAFPPRWTP